MVSPLNRTLISVTVDVVLRETDRDLAVERSSVLEHKATLGGRNGFQSFAAQSLLLVADELFDLFLLRVRFVAKGFRHDICAIVLAFEEVELHIAGSDVASHKVQRSFNMPHLVRNPGLLSNGLRCQAVRGYNCRRRDAFADAFPRGLNCPHREGTSVHTIDPPFWGPGWLDPKLTPVSRARQVRCPNVGWTSGTVGFPAHVQGRELPWQVEAECANEYLYGGKKYLYVAARKPGAT